MKSKISANKSNSNFTSKKSAFLIKSETRLRLVREKGLDLFYSTITMFLYRHTAHGAVMGQAFF